MTAIGSSTGTFPAADVFPGAAVRRHARWAATVHRIAVSAFVAATAVVPWAFTTRNEDVFTLPKLVALWAVLAAVTWLVMIGELGRGGARMLPFRPVAAVDGLVLAFLVLNVVATAFSTDPSQSLIGEPLQHQGLLTLLLCIAWFYAARVLVRTAARIDALFGAVTVGAVVVAAYAVVQELGLDPVWDGDVPGGRVFSTIGQPNALAAYLVVGIPVALALAARRGGPVRILALSGAGLMVVAVGLTSSRGGYLGLAVTAPLAALAWVHRDRRRQWGRVAGTFAVAGVVVLFCVLVPAARTAVADSWERARSVTAGGSDESIRNHVDQWRVGTRIVADHPMTGTGPETYPDQFPGYSRTVLPADRVGYFDQFRVESPHNELLSVAAGAGLPALIVWAALLVVLAGQFLRGVRRGRRSPLRPVFLALLAVLVGHVVTGSFMTAEVTGSWLFWVLMGAGTTIAASDSATDPVAPRRGARAGRDCAPCPTCPPSTPTPSST